MDPIKYIASIKLTFKINIGAKKLSSHKNINVIYDNMYYYTRILRIIPYEY